MDGCHCVYRGERGGGGIMLPWVPANQHTTTEATATAEAGGGGERGTTCVEN